MIRSPSGALWPMFCLALVVATPSARSAPLDHDAMAAPVPRQVLTSCDVNGRCYETGDPPDRFSGPDRDAGPGRLDRDDLPPPPVGQRDFDRSDGLGRPGDVDRPPPPFGNDREDDGPDEDR